MKYSNDIVFIYSKLVSVGNSDISECLEISRILREDDQKQYLHNGI